MTRRAVPFALAVALILVLAPAASARGFSYGVTAGEVTDSGAILWTRADRAGTVTLQVARNKRFSKGRKSYRLRAKGSADKTVQRRVGRLKPGARYYYRFVQKGRRRSATGTFRTAPSANANATVRFAWSGDTDAIPLKGKKTPYWNTFDVFKRMQGERNDFNVHLGDTIYSDSEVPGRTTPVAVTVNAKRAKYKLNLAQRKLQRLRGSAAFYSHWDDHEFVNDFARGENSFGGGSGPSGYRVNMNGQTLYKNGVRAFREYAPVSYTSRDGLYRSRRWGKNLEVFFLDERSFRSPKADVNGACNNPQSGSADLAPTAPQATRNLFAVVYPPLAQPVSAACKAAVNSPSRTFLGQRQYARFTRAVKASKARFKVVMNELPIQQYYVLPYDRWEGYEYERKRLLGYLKANVKNVVFLTTDVHATLVNDARLQTLEPGGAVNSGILDVTVGPAATENFGQEIDGATGKKGNGALVDSAFLEQQPPSGPGMQCSAIDSFSYGEVAVSSSKLTITPKSIQGGALKQDESGPAKATACGPFVLNYKP
jgi:alkaline phosphatase D